MKIFDFSKLKKKNEKEIDPNLKKKEKKVKHKLKHFLYTAGIYQEPKTINKYILFITSIIGIVEIIYLYNFLSQYSDAIILLDDCAGIFNDKKKLVSQRLELILNDPLLKYEF